MANTTLPKNTPPAKRKSYIRTDAMRESARLRLRTGKTVQCAECGNDVYKKLAQLRDRKIHFCSWRCSKSSPKRNQLISESLLGHVPSEETRIKLRTYTGSRSSGWKGGKPKCPHCGKEISYVSKRCDSCNHRHRTPEHQAKLNNAVSLALSGRMPSNNDQHHKFHNVQSGWHIIDGERLFFRSKWEVNYYLYLRLLLSQNLIQGFAYEPDVFKFVDVERSPRSYRPDFKVVNNDDTIEYHEVKGWMTPASQLKLQRMKQYYPQIDVCLIDSKIYGFIKKHYGKILGFI